MAAALAAVTDELKHFHQRAARQEEIIRQMQSRITELQGDQVQALLKPALQKFAGLHAQAMEASADANEAGEHSAAKSLGFFAAAVEEALGLVGLESVGAAPAVHFEAGRHHAVSVSPTTDPTLDGTIARVIRQGFSYPDASRVTLPAQVVVHKLTDDAPSHPTSTSSDEMTAERTHDND